jgi:23S rRNA (guanosine2251-2'-O)-methyltransferase
MKQVILHDIRSHYNVGAIFRTSDAVGVSKIFLSGLTPAPIDRFGRAVPEIHKTALGAEESVMWEKIEDCHALIKRLQNEGVTVVAVEQSSHSVTLYDFTPPPQVAYILGSETDGIPQNVLDQVDVILELPMKGMKESLNVSVTAGIVLYHT